jgi:hypothetical protein
MGLESKGLRGRIGRSDSVIKRRVNAGSLNPLDWTKPLLYSLLSRQMEWKLY